MKTRYDKSTDSLYVEMRPLLAHRTVEVEEDVFADLGEDGKPVGYDIQHASTKQAIIARLILDQEPPRRNERLRKPKPSAFSLGEIARNSIFD